MELRLHLVLVEAVEAMETSWILPGRIITNSVELPRINICLPLARPATRPDILRWLLLVEARAKASLDTIPSRHSHSSHNLTVESVQNNPEVDSREASSNHKPPPSRFCDMKTWTTVMEAIASSEYEWSVFQVQSKPREVKQMNFWRVIDSDWVYVLMAHKKEPLSASMINNESTMIWCEAQCFEISVKLHEWKLSVNVKCKKFT